MLHAERQTEYVPGSARTQGAFWGSAHQHPVQPELPNHQKQHTAMGLASAERHWGEETLQELRDKREGQEDHCHPILEEHAHKIFMYSHMCL